MSIADRAAARLPVFASFLGDLGTPSGLGVDAASAEADARADMGANAGLSAEDAEDLDFTTRPLSAQEIERIFGIEAE